MTDDQYKELKKETEDLKAIIVHILNSLDAQGIVISAQHTPKEEPC